MDKLISIVIPCYNGAGTIGRCLEAAFSSGYDNYEVVVVDDCSEDDSVEVIKRFPCKLIRLEKRSGTSKARNTGARNSTGEILFFIDADCLLQKDTLSIINNTPALKEPDVVVGGTYTRMPYDPGFFNTFQSVFVNYAETKKVENPDYIAAHAMIMNADTFRKSGGFPEDFMPIIEDIEFTHRLKGSGCRLIMNPDIQVRHIFNFTLWRSLHNAFRKVKYWNMYSIKNGDLFVDSGSASYELKINVVLFFLNLLLLTAWLFIRKPLLLSVLPVMLLINVIVSRRLIKAYYETDGLLLAGGAALYYTLLYPLPVGLGTIAGFTQYFIRKRRSYVLLPF